MTSGLLGRWRREDWSFLRVPRGTSGPGLRRVSHRERKRCCFVLRTRLSGLSGQPVSHDYDSRSPTLFPPPLVRPPCPSVGRHPRHLGFRTYSGREFVDTVVSRLSRRPGGATSYLPDLLPPGNELEIREVPVEVLTRS